MRAIGYARVSTDEQSRDGVSLEMQVSKIKAYCELNDLELVGIREDAGISAKNIKGRPRFQKALEMVYSGKAEALVVWKLDRAFRSTQDALSVAERLNKQGKALMSISEKLDTTSAIGEFFFTLMASLAQMERRLIGERTSAALQTKRAKGERVGEIPFGYSLAPDGKSLVEHQEEQRALRLIHLLREDGRSLRAISDELNRQGITAKKGGAWTHGQVQSVLRRAA